jgi:hypothetical protein
MRTPSAMAHTVVPFGQAALATAKKITESHNILFGKNIYGLGSFWTTFCWATIFMDLEASGVRKLTKEQQLIGRYSLLQ